MSGYPEIFEHFKRKEVVGDGASVFDCLGGSIRATYKKGWERNVPARGRRVLPSYPGLSEWTADWVASLLAAKLAGDRFGVVELGAGYGHWMVVSILAFKQLRPDGKAHGLALEADQTHFQWLQQHVDSNLGQFGDTTVDLRNAAAGFDGEIEFPVIEHPSSDYGASYGPHVAGSVVKVPCLSLEAIVSAMRDEPIDMLHCDIQGAEQDLTESPTFVNSLKRAKVVLFGTHRSDSLHQRVVQCVREAGFRVALEWPRKSQIKTAYGQLQTHDGAVLGIRSDQYDQAASLVDFNALQGEVV